ncbi:VIT family protein [Alteromonas stellipolaris]|jgi:VIT1/CCC1 family predicted Fe2+/Mn2+ transporter|uniref:VIT1/CCC1 transporter family protein n=1 Tax=Alteromonas stellipolaris TaxID=233316 RepID=UPI0026E3A71B|nr:VIT family protein [Alteromonas stellipolaris]MDO6539073.1 VIT family protein [Alteromonas stellipolaris]
MVHSEIHRSQRVGWLRAAVLGANDGIVSTASLIIGVAAASTSHDGILLAGAAGLVAGAMSMAAGEYVSVSSQSDTENADLAIEKKSLEQNFESEKEELAKIYERRGLKPTLAEQVAEELMSYDALGAHARDDIGISQSVNAQPIQAAFSSAAAFTVGAALPLAVAWLVHGEQLIPAVAALSLLFLAALGATAARVGGASITVGAIRVTFWGALAMVLTAVVGRIFGVVA